ncbi:hypothetical protein U9M48_016333 [Paspalum notatum var. saurae]|uniref:non-specific serine/threonine protein kinase n=1 Tax=Paspalum notatum var. saurae TaxID=547442 RepID=A0AAQ3WMZ6_PASNO
MGNSNCWGATKKINSDDTTPSSSLASPAAAASNSNSNSNSIMVGISMSSRVSTQAAALSSISSSSVAVVTMPPYHCRSEGDILQSANVRSFTFSDLRTCTRNFRPDSVLGEGGFGSVFKGWIDHNTLAPSTRPGTGMVIAVKKLNQQGFQGHREWLAEVNYLGQLSHPNLVKLVGYCLEDEQRLLVYEFMPRGSLENHLFRRSWHFQRLSWNLRMKVALGAAKGACVSAQRQGQSYLQRFQGIQCSPRCDN